MADTSGQAQIRGLDIDKTAKGFADVENVFKKIVTISKTSSREMRWYQKTSGFLAGNTTTGITTSGIGNAASNTLPSVTEQSWTRQTSYVRKYMVESPLITMEDINDTDVSVLATNIRDLTRAVARKVDERIWNVLTENQTPVNIQVGNAAGLGWDDGTNGNPINDLLSGKQLLTAQGYNAEMASLLVNSVDYKNLLNYLIVEKGSSIPDFSSEKVQSGIVTRIVGLNIRVSENVTSDYAALIVESRAGTYRQFMPLKAVVKDDPGIGKKIRIWEEGECILTDPKAVVLIQKTLTGSA